MTHRFYVPQPLQTPAAPLLLTGSEAHHLKHVLRLSPGSEVEVFDGTGNWAEARVDAVTRHEVTLSVLAVHSSPSEDGLPLLLAVAAPKGDRFRWLIEKATEIGVTELVPLLCARSVVEPRVHKLEKLRQTAIAAAKQCGRRRLLQIREPCSWSEFLNAPFTADLRLLADPSGQPITDILEPHEARTGVCCLVGPEGGFTPDELREAGDRGWTAVAFPTHILRTETAAIVAASYARLFGQPSGRRSREASQQIQPPPNTQSSS